MLTGVLIGLAAGYMVFRPAATSTAAPKPPVGSQLSTSATHEVHPPEQWREVAMADVLQTARDARDQFIAEVDDYTATLTKRERTADGVLQEPATMAIKVRTRHAGGKPGGSLAAYLKFLAPPASAGREVIWIEDQNAGKLQVREAGFVGAMMTVSIDPAGMLAMRGQRYPITELGLTNLLTKLIVRGEPDVDDPAVSVRERTTGGGEQTRRELVITRSKPSGRADDFSIARIHIDPRLNVVTLFESFGWPAQRPQEPPLIESYRYDDLRLNVGLGDLDFSVTNPQYTFAESSAAR